MKPSKEILSNGKGYFRETGWSHSGFTLLVKPNSKAGRFVVCGRDYLMSTNLLSFRGETVNSVAEDKRWTPEKLKKNPGLILHDLLEVQGDNLIVPDGVTTEVYADDRQGCRVLHDRLPILELAGVQVVTA
jgi:hypothetical protein